MLILCFFNDTATTEIYTLSLHDALPISVRGDRDRERPGHRRRRARPAPAAHDQPVRRRRVPGAAAALDRKEHTSELQSRQYLVCRLLLEKKNILVLCLSHTGLRHHRRLP